MIFRLLKLAYLKWLKQKYFDKDYMEIAHTTFLSLNFS